MITSLQELINHPTAIERCVSSILLLLICRHGHVLFRNDIVYKVSSKQSDKTK